MSAKQLLAWLGLAENKFQNWKQRYGQINEHNGKIPRDWWLEDWERKAIVDFHDRNPLEGYRRLTFMMLNDDIVAVSPSTVYRVLKAAGRLDRQSPGSSSKGNGFKQPKKPHAHWCRYFVYQRRWYVLLLDYITPADCLCGLDDEIHAERDRKLEEARVRRRAKSNEKSLALAS